MPATRTFVGFVPARGAGLVRPRRAPDRGDRPQQDLQVLADAVVLDVLALDREPLLEVQLAAAVNLHRAGQAGTHLEPEALRLAVALDQPQLFGARADQAHVAEQHVEELWQLVEAGAA